MLYDGHSPIVTLGARLSTAAAANVISAADMRQAIDCVEK